MSHTGRLLLLLGGDMFSSDIAVYCLAAPLAFRVQVVGLRRMKHVPGPSWSPQGTT